MWSNKFFVNKNSLYYRENVPAIIFVAMNESLRRRHGRLDIAL
jgi:hypothetical protein